MLTAKSHYNTECFCPEKSQLMRQIDFPLTESWQNDSKNYR